MPKLTCFRCNSDATGEDDFACCELGDIAIYFPDAGYVTMFDLCECCKQGLDSVVEKYLIEPPRDRRRGIGGHSETIHDTERGEKE